MVDLIMANIVPVSIFALLQLADVVTTVRGLRNGAREANGFVAALMDRLGYGWILVKLAIGAGAALLIVDSGVVWPLWALSAPYLMVVIHNWKVGSR